MSNRKYAFTEAVKTTKTTKTTKIAETAENVAGQGEISLQGSCENNKIR